MKGEKYNAGTLLTRLVNAAATNKKIRFALYIALAAILLAVIVGTGKKTALTYNSFSSTKKTEEKDERSSANGVETQLEEILSCIEGAGRVKVMLTYLENTGTEDASTEVCGVIVVAEGGANFAVRQTLIAAVSTVLGIDEKCVEVFVMSG